jgi:UDP:flavonoid glycosyltransferase YjiC (YdhE family)
VYLTFGSVAGPLGYFPGLYRAAIDALADLPVRLLVTIGEPGDPAEVGPVPGNVHVERWVEQGSVLPHAAVVVSHGGYGSMLGALTHGVPLVALPLFGGDQWRNARRVAQVGAGIAVEGATRAMFDHPGPAAIDALPGAVRSVLDDRGYGHAARAIGAAAAALPPVDAAVDVLRAIAHRGSLVR